MSETPSTNAIDLPRRTVRYGIGKAVSAVPEWHARQFMKLYDRFYYYSLSKEEKAVADRMRPALEKRAKALGWVATGAELAALVFGVTKGFQMLRDRQTLPGAVVPEPVIRPADIPVDPASVSHLDALKVPKTTKPFTGEVRQVRQTAGDGPMLLFRGSRVYPANDPFDTDFFRKDIPVPLECAIHPARSDRIVISVPGYAGSLDGFQRKYAKLAAYMQKNDIGAVLRTNNYTPFECLADAKARAALDYAAEFAQDICGRPDPELFGMGMSAGGGALAAIAHEYPALRRLLLINPSFDMPKDLIAHGLSRYTGELVILKGANDKLDPVIVPFLMDVAGKAVRKEVFTVAGADHNFSGKDAGRILSQAPLYAFARGVRPQFPVKNAGIVLYT